MRLDGQDDFVPAFPIHPGKQLRHMPVSVARADQSTLRLYTPDEELEEDVLDAAESDTEPEELIAQLEKEMRAAAAKLDFETAAVLRDRIKQLRG